MSRRSKCPRDLACRCHSASSRSPQALHSSSSSIVYVDHCNDPDCHEVEQLKALQECLDHFTDYEHYERCCDGHHHLHGKRLKDECCLDESHSHFSATKPCPEYFDGCEECIDEHKDCYDELEVCDDDCEQCEVECEEQGHEPEDCPRDHPTTRDNCIPLCKIEHIPLPSLGPTTDLDTYAATSVIQDLTPCTTDCSVPMQLPTPNAYEALSRPVFDSDMDHWHTFVQTHHCAPDPCTIGQPQQQYPQHMDPAFGFTFGCDPSVPGNQYPWQKQVPLCNIPTSSPPCASEPLTYSLSTLPTLATSKPPTSSKPSDIDKAQSENTDSPARTCEWIMPCGSICGATFPRTEDLKKHIKNSHSTKGTMKCSWKSCNASFASEAALTGHISKKHLTISDEEGPWKCTVPGCTKSFMYKQVRDDHVASHGGGNRMHCPICHQWLNCEGSNFRRHMASHGPKHEHMRCRFESLGCKKRFPRLDNLRRHEACCKFGKRAAGVHHHHHIVHVGHDAR